MFPELFREGRIGPLRLKNRLALALGARPEAGLYQSLQGKVKELYLIGDAREPGKALAAIHEGFLAALEI